MRSQLLTQTQVKLNWTTVILFARVP